jgi:hypothetical protein
MDNQRIKTVTKARDIQRIKALTKTKGSELTRLKGECCINNGNGARGMVDSQVRVYMLYGLEH